MTEKKTIGAFIAVLRKANGMTQRELAEKLNVSDKAVSRWERDECAPDLSLIPVLAEIFGITTDELLRGERKTPAGDTTEAPAEESAYIREKSTRQFQNLLRTQLLHLKERSMISYGLTFAGLIAALICNFVFTKAVLGFFLALVFYTAALITEVCFLRRAKVDEDDAHDYGKWLAYQNDITTLGIHAFFALWVCFGITLPFLFAINVSSVNAGLNFGSYFVLALICAVFSLIVGYIALLFFIKPKLLQRGVLFMTDTEKENQNEKRRLLKKTALASGISAGCLVLCAVFLTEASSSLATMFAERIRFDDYESYKEFMETPTGNGYSVGDVEVRHESVIIFPDGEPVYSDDEYDYYPTLTVEDKNGNVLCEYVRRNDTVSVTEFSFDKSDDGLPIFVITRDAYSNAYSTCAEIGIAVFALAVADVFLGIVIYLKKAKKYA